MSEDQENEYEENGGGNHGSAEKSHKIALRIPWYEAAGMIFLAVIFDLVGLGLNLLGGVLLVIGIGVLFFALNACLSFIAYWTFWTWFTARGVLLVDWVRWIVSIVCVVLEIAPVSSAGFFLTLNIFINLAVTYFEDITGIKISALSFLDPKTAIVRRAVRLSSRAAAKTSAALASGKAQLDAGRKIVRAATGTNNKVKIPRGARMGTTDAGDPFFYKYKTDYRETLNNMKEHVGKEALKAEVVEGGHHDNHDEEERPIDSTIIKMPQQSTSHAPKETEHQDPYREAA